MTSKQFADYIRYKTKTNSSTFTDAEILVLANVIKDDIAKEIVKCNEDIFGMEFLRNLEANKREYSMPTDILNNIKGVEAKIDGTNWYWLTEFDLNTYRRPTNESNIILDFADKNPMFDIFRKALWIYSGDAIIDVIEGLKLWAIIYPADISSLSDTTDMSVDPSTTSAGFPRQFHRLWATGVIIDYKESKEKPIPLSGKELTWDKDMEEALNAIKGMNLDRSDIASIPDDDGQDY